MVYRFEDFALDAARRELRRCGVSITLEPQVFDLIEFVIRNRDRVVSKEEIFAAVWRGRVVSDAALTTRINQARAALADDGQAQRLIRTVRTKGIRFAGTVHEEHEPAVQSAASRLPLPDRPSIAVLPFVNMSPDRSHEYLADSMTEDIITALSHIRWLFVIARTSTFTYKGKPIDIGGIGRELGVRYIIEGSVRHQEQRLRITVQLVQADTAAQIWAERYDRSTKDIFDIQDEITEAVAGAIEPEIAASERDRARRKAPQDIGAWDLYQRGWWHFLQQNAEHFAKARKLYREAAERDPTFAAPRAALAVLDYMVLARSWTDDPETLLIEIFEEASRAVALDADDSLSHAAMGLAFLKRSDVERAIGEHKVALALNPSSSIAHWSYGVVLNRAERFAEGIEHFDAAMRLSPRDPRMWQLLTFKASALYHLHRYEETIACARDATRHPTSDLIWPFLHLAGACGHLGRSVEAAAAIAELRRRKPGLTISSLRTWPNNQLKAPHVLTHILDGLRKAGLPP